MADSVGASVNNEEEKTYQESNNLCDTDSFMRTSEGDKHNGDCRGAPVQDVETEAHEDLSNNEKINLNCRNEVQSNVGSNYDVIQSGHDSLITEGSRSPSVNVSALNQICAYNSDSEDSVTELPIVSQSDDIIELKNNYNYRISQQVVASDSEEDSEEESEYTDDSCSTSSSSSGSSSSTAVVSSSDSDSDSDTGLPTLLKPDFIRNEELKTQGELSLNDLPPIEDLYITIQEKECIELGYIESIVDTLVVVQAKKDSSALDIDSILFLDQGKRPLGRVFDVFGPVAEPCYCVRFNSSEHIREKGIEKGMPVYCAPRSEYSSYVFLPDLLKMKGSDASWEFNNEPPEKYLDYSDDEEERCARKWDRNSNHNVREEDSDQPNRKRRNKYEQFMNSRNLRMSGVGAPVSSSSNTSNRASWGGSWEPQHGSTSFNYPPPSTPPPPLSSQSLFIRPPSFSVPPPRFGVPPPMFSTPPSVPTTTHPVIVEFDPRTPPPPTPPPPTPPPAQTPPSTISGPFSFPPPPPLPVIPCTSKSLPVDITVPPPSAVSMPFNISPVVQITSSNLFSIPPPPPPLPPQSFTSPLASVSFLSTPPPCPPPLPPAHW